jgi:hypothetical protein
VRKGGLIEGIGGGFNFWSCCRCGGIYSGKAGSIGEGGAGGEAYKVDDIYLLAAISSCHSLASNWVGVIRRTMGGGDKDDLEDKGIDKGLEDDDGDN